MDEIEHQGWRFQVAMAGRNASRFHAFYLGRDFGQASRGALAVVAFGLSDPDAASLAAHGLAEGYFGARATLSPLRAAATALHAINQWLFDQGSHSGTSMAVSLLALVFSGSRVSVVQVGDCQALCWRNQIATPLAQPQALPGAGFSGRAVGADQELPLDTNSEEAAAGDRYLLLTHGANWAAIGSPHTLHPQILADQLAHSGSNAIVIDVLAVPEANRDEIAALYAALPLRPPPHEGDIWDNFMIGKKLYQGPYTAIHLAEDRLESRSLVLKIPLPGILADTAFRAGFLRESWIGAQINSPWVAHYLMLPPQRQTSLYLAMPHYQGQTLAQRMAAAPPVDLLEGLAIAAQLCRALTDLARLQVVHRDIKPENILLAPNGNVRLLDLGMAYLPGIDALTQANLGGTTRYMAPELFKGVAANETTEIYALAITLYNMWSGGKFPFGQREKYPLQRLRPDLPAQLGKSLARALETTPEQRPPSAEAFATALDNLLMQDDAPPPASPNTTLRLWQIAAIIFGLGDLAFLLQKYWR